MCKSTQYTVVTYSNKTYILEVPVQYAMKNTSKGSILYTVVHGVYSEDQSFPPILLGSEIDTRGKNAKTKSEYYIQGVVGYGMFQQSTKKLIVGIGEVGEVWIYLKNM